MATGRASLLLGLLMFLSLGLWSNWSRADYENIEGVSPIIASTTASPPTYSLHILFIGNSFTSHHNLPQQLVDIASADPGNPTQLVIQSVTVSGVGLKEIFEDGAAVKAIAGYHWDYVVLQQHSTWAIDDIRNTSDYTERFDKLIKKAGAKTLIFVTWPDKAWSHWYTDKDRTAFRDPDYVMKQLIIQTGTISLKLGSTPVNVGLFWMYLLKQDPAIKLYEQDAHHPNINGSYLAALVFYKTLTGRDITKINFHPKDIPADVAEKIKAVVALPVDAPPTPKGTLAD